MPAIQATHSQRVAGLVIDGVPVIGLWDGDDTIMVDQREDEGSLLIGADGSSVWSQFIDNSIQITVKLLPSSPTNTQLQNASKRQDAGIPLPFSVTAFNVSGNESGTGNNFYIMRKSDITLGKNATVREWVLVSSDWRQD